MICAQVRCFLSKGNRIFTPLTNRQPLICPFDMHISKVLRSSSGNALFSLVIPTWNNLPYLQLLLHSLAKNAAYPHQIIVHVNEGSDGTLEWVQQQQHIDYTWSANNIGVCYALNACRSLVQTDYILYLNDDMYLCPGWDVALYRQIQQVGHPLFYLSGTLIENSRQPKPWLVQGNYGTGPLDFQEDKLLADLPQLIRGHWSGATWPPSLVHRDIWDLIGGYSTEFSPGLYSDPDFSMKLWNVGVRHFMGVGDALAYHFVSKTVGRITPNNGRSTFLWKWGMPSSAFVIRYLRQGQPFEGALAEPEAESVWNRSLYALKRILS